MSERNTSWWSWNSWGSCRQLTSASGTRRYSAGLGVRVVAAAREAAAAEEAFAAGDRERNDDAVADLHLRLVDVRADLFHDAHRLVAEHVAGLHEGDESIDEVQVGAADAGGRHSDDGVPAVEDLGVGDPFDLHRIRGAPDGCLHHDRILSGDGDAHGSHPDQVNSGRHWFSVYGLPWPVHVPWGCPMMVSTSPISMIRLKFRRSSRTTRLGLLPSSDAIRWPKRPAGGTKSMRTCTSVPRSSCRPGEKLIWPAFSTSAPGRLRQAIRRLGSSTVISASHSKRLPQRLFALATQCDRRSSKTRTDSRCVMIRGRFSKSRQKG